MTLPDCTLAVLRTASHAADERRAAAPRCAARTDRTRRCRVLRRLPEPRRWLALQAREKPVALSTRSTTLANARQTFAQLAYAKAGASSFERLSFAGKLLRELARAQAARRSASSSATRCPMLRCGTRRC